MTDRPIIFSAPMVRALLAGTKTQTRRLLKLPTKTHSGGPIYERPDMGGWEVTTHGGEGCFTISKAGERLPVPEIAGLWHRTTGTCVAPPYAPGDRLYVREHWKTSAGNDGVAPRNLDPIAPVLYLADGTERAGYAVGAPGQHRQGMHMPHWASRLTLAVTDVRVQRLQDISEADAIAEGIDAAATAHFGNAIKVYAALWNSLHGEDEARWEANPWIVAVTFDVARGNIDATLERHEAAPDFTCLSCGQIADCHAACGASSEHPGIGCADWKASERHEAAALAAMGRG